MRNARVARVVIFLTLFTLLKLGGNLSAAFTAAETQGNGLSNILGSDFCPRAMHLKYRTSLFVTTCDESDVQWLA